MSDPIQTDVITRADEKTDFLSIKDAYTLYEEGKKRRYGLLFTVNGGAFAIAKLLTSEGDKLLPSSDYKVLGHLSLTHLAIGMILFTALMCFDIFVFGQNVRDRHLGEVFGPAGKAILGLLGLLIVFGWLLAAFDFSPISSKQSAALLFPIGFLGIFRLFPLQLSSR